ncbi:MAG TPA: hypothetical protein VFJ77_07415 [Gaiellaceae bacterium]|nr:hypothetical protein [Gaiellaceae bacterium]
MTRMIQTLGTTLVVFALFAGVAAAASLGIASSGLATGGTTGIGCVSSSLTATRTVDNSGTITRVDVLNIPQACAGQTLSLTLRASNGASLAGASATVPGCVGGCSLSFGGLGTIDASSLAGYAIQVKN